MIRPVCLGLLLLGCRATPPDPAVDGEATPRRLRDPAEFPAAFTVIRAVMALPDGRIVVTDPAENRISLLDFPKGSSRLLGRVGDGPLEYRRASGLYRAPGGGVWVFDHELRRLLPIGPSGAVQDVVTVPFGGIAGDWSAHGPDDLTFDSLGNVYEKLGRFVDSTVALFRLHPGKPRDTVTRLRQAVTKPLQVKRSGLGTYQSVLFSPSDAWSVAPDGWVAVARATPYRVEWIPPTGTTVSGPAIFHRPLKISQAEKEFIASGAGGLRGVITVGLAMVAPGSGGPSSRPTPPEPMPVRELLFAKTKPAVNLRDDRWPLLDENGRLWVQRSLPFGMKVSVFDVFDRRGQLVERVELPEGSRLVGFDRSWIYTARQDADDFEHLQRFPLSPP